MVANVLGLIPARGGSKGIPRKNVKDLAGEPLIGYTIRAANGADWIDRTVVSTDDEEIRSVARDYEAEAPFLRPANLADDDTPMAPVVEHALEYVRGSWAGAWNTVVLLQPTSPLRDADDIDRAKEIYKSTDSDSLVSVSEDHSYRWERTSEGAQRLNYGEERTRRQEKSPEYIETGGIYAVDADRFLETTDLQAGTTELCVVDRPSAVDIDTDFEFWLAEQLVTYWNND